MSNLPHNQATADCQFAPADGCAFTPPVSPVAAATTSKATG